MSNPWRESFDDLRYENGNTYDYFENISEAAPYAVDFRKVREAVYQIKQKAKRDNVRLPVAMNQYFSTANLGPAERAAIRAKIMGMREDVELDENIQAIQRGYASADRNTAQALGRAQQAQQRMDAMRSARNQKKQKLTTGGAPTQFGEETMTSSDKAKEKRLKSKYDKSGMKQSMIDQYGEKKGKQVYFAKIRKMAMEGLESFVEEKYGEKEEKKYKKSGKKSKDYDGDGEVEDESHEYAGVKDRAIKKAMRKESSDWRADLGFFTEKRYPESPRVETMPPEKQNDSEQAPKERAANKRLKPKSAEVKESIQEAFLDYGAEVISVQEGAIANPIPALRSLTKVMRNPVTYAEPTKRALSVIMNPAPKAAKTPLSIIMNPAPKAAKAPLSINLSPAPKVAKNVVVPFKRRITAPKVVSAKPQSLVAPPVTKPVTTPKPKPTPTKPSVEPQRQPEVPTSTKPAKSVPAIVDLETGIIQKVAPQGTKVKFPKPTGKPTKPQTQPQAQPQKVANVPPTGIGIGVETPTTGDGRKKDWELPKLGMPRAGYGQGRTWVARSL